MKSNNKSAITPDSIKKIILVLTLNEILYVGYNDGKKCAVFSLAHSNKLLTNQNARQTILATNNDLHWANINTK